MYLYLIYSIFALGGLVLVICVKHSTWSFQSTLELSSSEDYAKSPFIIRGQGEQVLFSGYDDGTPGVYVHTSSFSNKVIWTMQAKLSPPDALENNGDNHLGRFGCQLSVVASTLIASSPYKTIDKKQRVGATYLFKGSRNVWTLQQTLLANDGKESDQFGFSISVHNNTLMVGANSATVNSKSKSGCVYVFNTSDVNSNVWTQQQKLVPSDATAGDEFGEQISVTNSTLIVSSRNKKPSGAAYIFTYSGSYWSEQQKLVPRDAPKSGFEFGWSPVAEPHIAVVGAYDGKNGSVYVFTTNGGAGPTWSETAKLQLPEDISLGRPLGTSLALYNQTLLIGSNRSLSRNSTLPSGAVVYHMNYSTGNLTWSYVQSIMAPPGSFYSSVSLFEGNAIVTNESMGLLFSTFANRSCLQIVLGDHFQDGWDTAKLRIELRDYPHIFTEYSPHFDTVYPMSFRYCPLSVEDTGAYQLRIRYFNTTTFKWEISYQVFLEATGHWYHGDFSTRMVFRFDKDANAFLLEGIENAWKPIGCRVCTTVAVQNWVQMQVSGGGDSWLIMNAQNSSFFISDPKGNDLFSYGMICNSGGKYLCIQTLKDGQYVMRSGSGYGEPGEQRGDIRLHYKAESSNLLNWYFCGYSGKIFTYLYFNITNGDCQVGTRI